VLASAVFAGLITVAPTGADADVTGTTGPDDADITAMLAAPHAPDRVIVTYRSNPTTATRDRARRAARATSTTRITRRSARTEVFGLARGQSVAKAIESLSADPNVLSVEPDYVLHSTATSNDPDYMNGLLWGMYGDATSPANEWGSQAGEAWAAGHTGSRDVYVVVIDEGVDVAHPDLAANMWTNPFDPVDGIDNDGNGYVDDAHGWDFFSNDASVFDGGDAHGTHVAGTIGGVGGNGRGVVGVNWNVTMISAKFLGPNGGYTSGAIAAVDYATDLKVRHGLNIVATNNSWGGGGYSSALHAAIERGGDAGILFIAAAGNSASNNDAGNYFPANYECTKGGTRGWDCVVAVAATTNTGGLASFSSYGATRVDIGAPGAGIRSTLPNNSYGTYSGTSMATPHVAGAVALCASMNSTLSARDVRDAVMASAAPTDSLAGRTVTGGRLDVGAMVPLCEGATEPVTGAPSGVTATANGMTEVNVSWGAGSTTGQSSWEIERGDANCSSFVAAASAPVSASSVTVGGLSASTTYCFRVRGRNTFGGGSAGTWSSTATATTAAPPTPYTCEATTYSWVPVSAATTHALGDDADVQRTMPFSFRLYQSTSTSLRIGSNGFLRLGTGSATAHANTAIPNANEPNGIIAPWWDDLDPSVAGSITSQTTGTAPNRRFVVTWTGVPHFGQSGSNVTFQAILEETTNAIVFQYQDATTGFSSTNRGTSATVGLEDPTGTWGTQHSFNTASILDGTAIRCTDVVPPLTVTTSVLPSGTTGTSYSASLTAVGGKGPHAWSITGGALPDGLALASSGAVTGTPTAAGTATITVEVADADGETATSTVSIEVSTPVAVTSTSLPAGNTVSAYETFLAAEGGKGAYTWSIASGSLPGGLSLTSSTGRIAGTPTSAGTWNFTVRATDTESRVATRALSITVSAPPAVSAGSLPGGTVGSAYSATLGATGGTTPYTWTLASGVLPAGLSLSVGGVISGQPTTAGTSSFTVRVTGNDGLSSTAARSITVTTPFSITTESLPDGVQGTAYRQTLTASGGTGTLSWSRVSGTLPNGVSLSSAGVLSGTPSAANTFTFTVRVTDGASRTAQATFTVVIAPAPPGSFNKSSPSNGATGRSRSRLSLSWGSSARVTRYEVCWDTIDNGVCDGTWTSTNTTRSITVRNLLARTTYYWQVRAVNAAGETHANAGTWWRFTTGA
jgi:subtilisin family serine protease